MPKVGRPPSGPHDLRACTECRKRKSKCSGSLPCSYCTRTNKSCVFSRPPSRTPLTRKNLDAAELRCAKLISLIQIIDPDIDIHTALDSITGNGARESTVVLERPEALESDPEIAPSLDQFEWNEASNMSPSHLQKEPLDGMAVLPTKRSDAGYLGNTSGSTMLNEIPGFLPDSTIHWSRNRPHGSPASNLTNSPSQLVNLADATTLESLVDAYFGWYNPSYPILHEKTFREQFQSRSQVHPRSSWHVIFHLVLAIGHWILGEESEAEESKYYVAARSWMSMRMLESGTLLTVQACLLMGNYLQKRDRPNTGYNFIGIAHRMALGLGLHREFPTITIEDTLSSERRRVLWWIVYCFDSGFSITTGRPITVSDSFIETHLPRNIDDSACSLESALPPVMDFPTTYSAIIAQSRLTSIANAVFGELISSTNKTSWNLRVSRAVNHQFNAWKLSLPSYFTAHTIPEWFRGPRAIIIWKEQNLRMMLWWGTQKLCNLPSDHEEAQNICLLTAVETIQEITNFIDNNLDIVHAGLSWYATYFLFQAVVVLSIHHLQPLHVVESELEERNQDLWLSSVSRARDGLASLSQKDKAATRCLSVLNRLRDHIQQQALGQPSAISNGTRSSYQVDLSHEEVKIPSTSLAVDPTLQMFFEDPSWGNDLFHGLRGFPSTDEVGVFDYVPSNTY